MADEDKQLPAEAGGADDDALWREVQASRASGKPAEDGADGDGGAPAAKELGAEPEPGPEPGPEPEPAKEGDDEPSEKEAEPEDPWAGLPEEHRERVKQLQAERDDFKHKFTSDFGRIAALQRKIDELTAAQRGSAAAAPEEIREKLEAVTEEYPEIAGPFVQAFQAQQAMLNAIEARDQRLFQAEHGDMTDVLRQHGAEFHAWRTRQPDVVNEIIAKNSDAVRDYADVSFVMSRFKQHLREQERAAQQGAAATAAPAAPANAETGGMVPPANPRRTRQLEGARTPPHRGPAATIAAEPTDPDGVWEDVRRLREEKKRRMGG